MIRCYMILRDRSMAIELILKSSTPSYCQSAVMHVILFIGHVFYMYTETDNTII